MHSDSEFDSQPLGHWDEQETESLVAFYTQNHRQDAFLEFLVAASSVASTQSAATWLLKHSLEQGHEIGVELRKNLFKNLRKLSTWPAKLHLLQCLQWLDIPARNKKQIEHFGRSCLQDENKYVCTWALTALHRLAHCHEEYSAEVTELLVDARDNGASASIRARARQLLKQQMTKLKLRIGGRWPPYFEQRCSVPRPLPKRLKAAGCHRRGIYTRLPPKLRTADTVTIRRCRGGLGAVR